MAAYTGTLMIYNSRTDGDGNRYWAFEYTDHTTGKAVYARITGGKSNIENIRHNWQGADGWNASILVHCVEMGIREFNQTVKGWKHAGCRTEDLQQFILDGLAA